jgi:glycosyltransferase involved in cell wall biosynthesis
MPETAADAALLADPNSPEDIAKQMLAIYKDETLRDELVQKGKLRAADFSWDITANLVWNSILKTIQD